MPRLGYVALVLHAHLPYPDGGLGGDELATRWLLETTWECYLPLLGMLDRLATEQVDFGLTLSLAPPLLSMLRAAETGPRMEQHLEKLRRINDRERKKTKLSAERQLVGDFYEERLGLASRQWQAIEADPVSRFDRHRRAGRLDLMTSSASHGFLPGLAPRPAAVGAQLEIARRSATKLMGSCPIGLWLPECAFDQSFGRELARARFGYTVLDAHGLSRGHPRPWRGAAQPIIDRWGVAYFGRNQAASHRVWSRAKGYPGDPAYRDFYRDLGFERPDEALEGLGAGAMTGLKLHRITGRGERKEIYRPAAAAARVEAHAAHFVETCRRSLGMVPPDRSAPPVLVAAYDAELFGHWWFEGPAFLEAVLRRLASAADLEATTLASYLARHPECPPVEPASSTWGQGGHGEVWVGPSTAHLWRHVHHAHDRVQRTVEAHRQAAGPAGEALDQAVRELLLLQASDWLFMIHGGDLRDYGERRFRRHYERTLALCQAVEQTAASQAAIGAIDPSWFAGSYLQELHGEELRDVF